VAASEWERRKADGNPVQVPFTALVAAARRLLAAGWDEPTVRAVFAETPNFSTAALNTTRSKLAGRGNVAVRTGHLAQVVTDLADRAPEVLARSLGVGVGEELVARFAALREAQAAHPEPLDAWDAWRCP
jgi:hypothetical protein